MTTSQDESSRTLLCQSVIVSGPFSDRRFACSVSASTMLFGVHLCLPHARAWQSRLQRGEKIRIHPERALPLDHRCTPQPLNSTGGETANGRTCRGPCGETKPPTAFYRNSRGQSYMTWCKQCWCKRTEDNARRRRSAVGAIPAAGPEEQPAPPAPPEPAVSRVRRSHSVLRPGPRISTNVTPDLPGAPKNKAELERWERALDELPPPAARPAPRPASVRAVAARPLLAAVELDEPAEEADEDDGPPGGPLRYVYFVEFVCLLCGRWIADVASADPKGKDVHTPGQRCRACGGAPMPSGDVSRKLAPEVGIEETAVA